jgi:outer membrane protein insertion porin family/translocation and assembly module TamA
MRQSAVFFSNHPEQQPVHLASVVKVNAPRMSRHTPSLSLAIALLVVLASAACKEEGGVKVTSFKFNGVHAVTDGQLRSVLATAASSRLPFGAKHYFNREQFEADLKRIEAFYRDRGYPDARVSSFDVQLSDDQSSVKVAVTVAEGEPIRVERIVFSGIEPLPEEHRRALEANLPLKQGAALDRAILQASREATLDELKDHGFPYASVRLAEEPGSSERLRIVTLQAEPGALAHFGPLDIQGNSSVRERIIRRQLTFRRGDLYQESKLVESQRRLYALELFQFASVKSDTQEKVPEIPTRITVKEGKHRKVNFGVGYGSEERARAEIDWRHVNFFGGGRSAGVVARYSGLDRGVRLNLTEPYFFSRNYSLGLSGQSWHSDEPAYDLDTTGGRATLTRRFGRVAGPVLRGNNNASTSLSFTYANEYESSTIAADALADLSFRDELIALGLNPTGLDQEDPGVTKGLKSAVFLDAGRNTTGNLLDARQGYVANVHLEQAGGWLRGDYEYYEATLEGRYYLSLGRRAVVAVRARGGSIDGLGDGEAASPVPFHKRYFLGGATNLRGWGRFDVSPLSGSGLPIGGQTMVNFSTELRAPLVGNLGGVLFLDAGNVWEEPWDFNLNDMRYDVGPGLRYNTPIGPLRVDLGYQLNPIPGLLVNGKPEPRRFRVHFSIGQAF